MSASLSCPNESETTDKGDLSVIPDHSTFHFILFFFKGRGVGWGLLSSSRRAAVELVGSSHVAQKRKEKPRWQDLYLSTLWSKKLLKIVSSVTPRQCFPSLARNVTPPLPVAGRTLTEQPLASHSELSSEGRTGKVSCCHVPQNVFKMQKTFRPEKLLVFLFFHAY